MKFDALIFDLDGTLVNSAPDVREALNHAFSPFSASFDLVQIHTFLSHGLEGLIQGAFDAAGLRPTSQQFDAAKTAYLNYYKKNPVVYTHLYPGVLTVLLHLKEQGVKLGICSNKPSETAKLVIQHLKLDEFFTETVAGDDTPRKKPDPFHVELTLRRLGASPEKSAIVGDSIADLQAGRAAGLKTFLFAPEKKMDTALMPLADKVFFEYRDFLASLI